MKTKELVSSKLYDQNTFFKAFEKDLKRCNSELVIESPFITLRRLNHLLPLLRSLKKKGVNIIINTREPSEYDENNRQIEVNESIFNLQQIGVTALFTVGHHRKLAIIDRKILWEGSLNILSQNDSCEIMRRAESKHLSKQLIQFIRLSNFIKY